MALPGLGASEFGASEFEKHDDNPAEIGDSFFLRAIKYMVSWLSPNCFLKIRFRSTFIGNKSTALFFQTHPPDRSHFIYDKFVNARVRSGESVQARVAGNVVR